LFGEFKAAPDIRINGPAAGGGYLLPVGQKVKVAGGCQGVPGRKPARSRSLSNEIQLVNDGYRLPSNPNKTAIRILKAGCYPDARSIGSEG